MTGCEGRRSRFAVSWLMVAGLCASSPALGASYKVDVGSTVKFLAKITASSFEAKSDAVSGSVDYDAASGKLKKAMVVVKVASLETGIGMRDRHMREKYLEVDKFPEIKLELKEAAALTAAAIAKGVELVGEMTVKGSRRPVKVLVVAVDGGSGKVTVTSSFPLEITQFGIPQPNYAVVKMDPVINVSVTLVLTPAS